MVEKNKQVLPFILLIFGSMLLVLIFYEPLLNLASTEGFIQNYLLVLSVSLFALGFIALQIKSPSQLRADLLNASLWAFVSLFLGIIYLAYSEMIFLNVNFATLSFAAFLGGLFYFFLILIKERINT